MQTILLRWQNFPKIDKAQLSLISEAKNQENSLASSISATQNQINATLKQIEAIRNAAPRVTSVSLSRGSAPISSNNIAAYATNFLGTPYVWGGTTPVPALIVQALHSMFTHISEQVLEGLLMTR
jgi:cell wall-associated NlpC family hydrolase